MYTEDITSFILSLSFFILMLKLTTIGLKLPLFFLTKINKIEMQKSIMRILIFYPLKWKMRSKCNIFPILFIYAYCCQW